MRFRNTLLVLLVFALLGGYTYFFEIKGKGKAEEATPTPTAISLWEMSPTDVIQLDISGPDGRTRLVRAGEAPWDLVNLATEAKQPADDARVDRIVDTLARLQATRVFTNTPALAEYGLATPAWRADIHLQDGRVKTLRWGDQTPQGTAYYVKQEEGGTVYVIAAFAIEDLERLVREPAYPPTPTPTSTATPVEGAATATPPASHLQPDD